MTYLSRIDLNDDEKLEAFAKGYVNSFAKRGFVARREIPLEELRQFTQVYGIYRGEKMVAGFALNYYPRRCFEGVPDDRRVQILAELGGESQVCELVAIWKSDEMRSPWFTPVMWMHIMSRTLEMDRRYIFGSNRNQKVASSRYYSIQPRVVYAAKTQERLDVFYYTRLQFVGTYFASLFGFIPRVIGRAIWTGSERQRAT
jgi:hypothetical protein